MIVLAIETSCDETAVAVLQDLHVLASSVYSQTVEHRAFGGVVPEIASRAHVEKINAVLDAALKRAEIKLSQVDLIAATAGPGLIGALAVGFSFGKGLALSLAKPFIGIHHMEAHLLANQIEPGPGPVPPYLALIISGGHTELVDVKEAFTYSLWSRTRDDAAGEAFDKIGKLLGLDYPAGRTIGELARKGDRGFMKLPVALPKNRDFSFSGLKTSVYYAVKDRSPEWIEEKRNDICACVEEAIVEALLQKSLWAMEEMKREHLVLAGGVACNGRLRERLDALRGSHGFSWSAPPPQFCTDNAAMIAAAAHLRYTQSGLAGSHSGIFASRDWYGL